MKLHVFLFIVPLFLLFACKSKSNQKDSLQNDDFQINEELAIEVKEFHKAHKTWNSGEHLIMVELRATGDTSVVELTYELNMHGFKNNPPNFFTTVDDIDLAVKSEDSKLIRITNNALQLKLKQYFPSQYAAYEKYGELQPPITYRDVPWILKFKEGTLVSKEPQREY